MYKRKSTFNERDVIFLYEYGRRAMIERERRINKLKQKMREREGKPGDEYCAISTIERSAIVSKCDVQCNAFLPTLVSSTLVSIFLSRQKSQTRYSCLENIISTNSHLNKNADAFCLISSLSCSFN